MIYGLRVRSCCRVSEQIGIVNSAATRLGLLSATTRRSMSACNRAAKSLRGSYWRTQALALKSPVGGNCNGDFVTVIFWGDNLGCMLPKKWRLAVFAMAFFSVLSDPCAAGPITWKEALTLAACRQQARSFFVNPLPQPWPFSSSATTEFHPDGFDLSHLTAPPDFRRLYPVSATADILQTTPRLIPPCPRNFHGLNIGALRPEASHA